MPNRDPKEQQEFDRLVAIINEGVTVWNDWRDSHPGMAIDLSDVQLRGADLRGINLTGAILWHADLRGSNLVEANLINAQLGSANLTAADLRRANLDSVPQRENGRWSIGTDLEAANFSGADLRSASLRGADLTNTSFYNANLQSASLCGVFSYPAADFSNANLRGADLKFASLARANLTRADLRDADLRGSDLRGATLFDANLDEADLRGADLSRSRFPRLESLGIGMGWTKPLPELVATLLPGGRPSERVHIERTKLTNANLRGADLRGTFRKGADLARADLRGAELRFDHPLWIGWLLAGMVSLFGANNWLVYIVLYAVTGVSFGHLYCSRHWRTGFLVGLPLFFWSLLTPGRVTISAITLAVSTLSVRVGGLLDIETKHVLSRDRSQLKVRTGDTIRYRARKGDQRTSVIANITKDGKPIEEAYLLSRSHRVTCYVIELQDGELIAPHLVAFN